MIDLPCLKALPHSNKDVGRRQEAWMPPARERPRTVRAFDACPAMSMGRMD